MHAQTGLQLLLLCLSALRLSSDQFPWGLVSCWHFQARTAAHHCLLTQNSLCSEGY